MPSTTFVSTSPPLESELSAGVSFLVGGSSLGWDPEPDFGSRGRGDRLSLFVLPPEPSARGLELRVSGDREARRCRESSRRLKDGDLRRSRPPPLRSPRLLDRDGEK
mmetsp:Transcript_76022/g.105590  ORF Transcript_76022/g.105590 Transcript_76022/m.105590 type:complete len:107 (-) Transcript_76022:9-329(-)